MATDSIDWVERAKQEPIVDIGQISDLQRRALDKAAKRGEIAKWRGHWDSFSPDFGMGPLKTCFGPVPYEAMVESVCGAFGAVTVNAVADAYVTLRAA